MRNLQFRDVSRVTKASPLIKKDVLSLTIPHLIAAFATFHRRASYLWCRQWSRLSSSHSCKSPALTLSIIILNSRSTSHINCQSLTAHTNEHHSSLTVTCGVFRVTCFSNTIFHIFALRHTQFLGTGAYGAHALTSFFWPYRCRSHLFFQSFKSRCVCCGYIIILQLQRYSFTIHSIQSLRVHPLKEVCRKINYIN